MAETPNIKIQAFQYPFTPHAPPDVVAHGMHTNGPRRYWINVDGVWYDTGCYSAHLVKHELKYWGPKRIMKGESWGGNRYLPSDTDAPIQSHPVSPATD